MGLFLAFCGAVLFCVDAVTLNPRVVQTTSGMLGGWGFPSVVNPPDWMPFSLIGLGAITLMYAVALPRRGRPVAPEE